MSQDSGRIWLDGEVIRYRSETFGSWDLLVGEVLVIGEMTNQDGPFTDDYFFCFASGPGMWKEASFYAEGRDVFLKALSQRLEFQIAPKLQYSTDFASRSLWPAELVGKEMFKFVDNVADGVIERMLQKIFGVWSNKQYYSDLVRGMLEGTARV